MKKILASIFLVLTLITPVCVNGSTTINVNNSTPKVDASEKVYDFADLLTDNEEKIIYDKIQTFIKTYNMDLAVVTINENNKNSQADYADDFYDYNDFGLNEHHDGLLFLIDMENSQYDMENSQYYISTTGEAIRMYDDYRIEGILDYIESYMINGNYYEATVSFINKISSYADSGIPTSNKNTYIDETGDIVYIKKINIFASIILSGIITLVVILILVNKNKMIKKAEDAYRYVDKNNINITQRNDQFITTHTTSVIISSSSGGGGSSTHRGSSGRSHGGGGRGF